jgi:hypothetical protein
VHQCHPVHSVRGHIQSGVDQAGYSADFASEVGCWNAYSALAPNPSTIFHHHEYMPTSQQLQSPRNPINHALRRRPNTQHRQTTSINLRPARISDDLSRNPQTPRHAHKLRHIILALDLHGNLRLPTPLPALQDPGLSRLRVLLCGLEESLVACQRRVAALGCYLAYTTSLAHPPSRVWMGGETNPSSSPNPS